MQHPQHRAADAGDATHPLWSGRFYQQFRDRLVASACRLLDDPAEAEDVVQDVFTSALAATRKTGDDSRVQAAYLFIGVRRKCYRTLIRRRRTLLLEPAAIDEVMTTLKMNRQALQEDDGREQIAQLSRLVATLPRRCRDVLILRLEGFSYAEIAARLGIRENTVNAHLQRAKNLLRRACSS